MTRHRIITRISMMKRSIRRSWIERDDPEVEARIRYYIRCIRQLQIRG